MEHMLKTILEYNYLSSRTLIPLQMLGYFRLVLTHIPMQQHSPTYHTPNLCPPTLSFIVTGKHGIWYLLPDDGIFWWLVFSLSFHADHLYTTCIQGCWNANLQSHKKTTLGYTYMYVGNHCTVTASLLFLKMLLFLLLKWRDWLRKEPNQSHHLDGNSNIIRNNVSRAVPF